MSEEQALFHEISAETPSVTEGKMFGALCLKTEYGKVCAIFWEDSMLFKLDDKDQAEALKLNGAKIGAHLYNPGKLMKGWVLLPSVHIKRWPDFTLKAITYVNSLTKIK